MIIDCISDLHGSFPVLNGGDLLIIAGDLTACDRVQQYVDFNYWLAKQKYKKKIVVAGNHDNLLQDNFLPDNKFCKSLVSNGDYLFDSDTEFQGLKIWGSPWTKNFSGQNAKCMAFGLDLTIQMMEKWDLIPEDVDILVTHTPPFGMLDNNEKGNRYGCPYLADRLLELKKLKLHVFGHIHEGYGQCNQAYGAKDPWDENLVPHGHLSVNASLMNASYEFVNEPIRVVL